jgi:hypothetical protein
MDVRKRAARPLASHRVAFRLSFVLLFIGSITTQLDCWDCGLFEGLHLLDAAQIQIGKKSLVRLRKFSANLAASYITRRSRAA